VQRLAVGIIAILLIAASGLMRWQAIGSHEMASISARVGLVMCALWLAMPRSGRPINWWFVLIAVALMVGFARLPRAVKLTMVGVLPFVAAWWWLQNRRRRS
jgi:hypothetical protein